MGKNNIILFLVFVSIVISVYFRWFLPHAIIGGDWSYYFPETLKEFSLFVPSWNTWQANGLGGTNPAYFLQTFQNLTVFLSNFFHIPWVLMYKIFWFGLYLIIAIFSSIYFSRTMAKKLPMWTGFISCIIFLTNTYVLLLADGGQLGVLLAYSISPLVVSFFVKIIDALQENLNTKRCLQSALLAGFALSIQVMFDPRIAYIALLVVLAYFIFNFLLKVPTVAKTIKSLLVVFVIPLVTTVLLNAFWIFPSFFLKQNFSNDFGDAYSGIGMVKFLSFASFSQTFSLLHPNWPENLFGKVYFMRWEFLIIPLIAYVCFYFYNRSKKPIVYLNTKILFMGILGLLGAFLAKGAHEPFGNIYLWLFQHVPGFIFFRDPTKFYLVTILAYSILIPTGLMELIRICKRFFSLKALQVSTFIIVSLFLIFWSFTIRQAIFGQLNGTFSSHSIPFEYIKFKDFLNNQPDFFRTLWIPRQNRFTFYSNSHPSVEAVPLFHAKNSSQVIQILKNPSTQQYLMKLSIKYLVVPYDSFGELFQKDRKYNPSEYQKLVKKMQSISGLSPVQGFGKIIVFQLPSYVPHIFSVHGSAFTTKMISPSHYSVKLKNEKKETIIFSEKYNPYWVLRDKNKNIISERTPENLNSFVISETGTHNFDLYFSGEKYFQLGRIISLITFIIILLLFIFTFKKCNSLHKE